MPNTHDGPEKQAPSIVQVLARAICRSRGVDPDARESGLVPGRPADGGFGWQVFGERAARETVALLEAAGYRIVPVEAARVERCAEHGVIYPAGGRCGLCAEAGR